MKPTGLPHRPALHAEKSLIQAILDGRYPTGSTLPAERELAAALGVTRPTLREALQRLHRDGWISIRHGKGTVVNDYWAHGGLNVLSALVRHGKRLPDDFIRNLLEVRTALAPAYARAAVDRSPAQVLACLEEAPQLALTAAGFARFDWSLHRSLAAASGNPIHSLILNGFAGFYEEVAGLYFAHAEGRRLSQSFYAALARAARLAAARQAERVTRDAMEESAGLWRRVERRLARQP